MRVVNLGEWSENGVRMDEALNGEALQQRSEEVTYFIYYRAYCIKVHPTVAEM